MKYDVVIFGSGIMGLVTAWIFQRRGYRVLVLEKEGAEIGGVQTLASQGILHSGFKYLCRRGDERMYREAISWWYTILTSISEDVILSKKIAVVGNDFCSKCKVWLASKMFRGNTTIFYNKGTCVTSDNIVAVDKLVKNLSKSLDIMAYDPDSLIKMGNRIRILVEGAYVEVMADWFVCAAGEGNKDLFGLIARHTILQNKRTFKMFTIKESSYLPTMFAHYVTKHSGLKPMYTITSIAGDIRKWDVGGKIAEGDTSIPRFIKTIKSLRGINFNIKAEDISYKYVDVAEVDGTNPYVFTKGNCIVAYPGKLVLAPYTAMKIMGEIEKEK